MDEETEIVEVVVPLKVPNAWRAMAALREAWEMIEQNPDLVGDDLAIALKSEAPDAVSLLDALVSDCQHARMDEAKADAYVELMAARAAETTARAKRKEEFLMGVMQQLHLRSHHAPAGTASLKAQKGKVIITNAPIMPSPFRTEITVIEVSIDKRLIGKEFDAGRKVDGAERANAYDTISIRPGLKS